MALDLTKQIADVDTKIGTAEKRQQAGFDQQSAMVTRQAEERKPINEAILKDQGEAAQFIERRQAGRPVIPEFKPQPPIDAKEFEGMSYALIGLAMIGGAVSKGNWLGVADTLNGAMKGFIDGNHALAKKNAEDYDKQFKSAMAHDQQYMRNTEEILKSKNLSINQKNTQLKILAAEHGDEAMLSELRQKSIDGTIKTLYAQKNTLTNAQQRHEDNVANMRQRAETARRHDETLKALRGGGGDTAGLDQDIALARTGMPPNQVVRGIGGQATQRWNQVKAGAIKQIMSENPGMTLADAAVIFATEQQEFKANSGALNQITKDMAAIRPYKEMLDKNADIAIDLAEKGVLTSSRVANRSLNWLRQNAADYPDSSEYLAQMRIVTTEAARVLNNPRLVGQLTDSARHEMETIISGDMPIKSTKRVLERLKSDGQNRVSAMEKEQRHLLKRSDPAPAPAPATPTPGVDPAVQQKVDKMAPEERERRLQELRDKAQKTSSVADVIDFSELAA